MKAWLEDLAPRERLLLGLAAGLTLLLALWFLVVAPLWAGHAEAERRYDASARALDIVADGVRRISPTQETNPSAPQKSQDELRRLVTVASQETGLALMQVRSESDGQITAVFRDVDPRLVFAFLQILSARDGIEPSAAVMNRSEEGLVSASFSFQGAEQ